MVIIRFLFAGIIIDGHLSLPLGNFQRESCHQHLSGEAFLLSVKSYWDQLITSHVTESEAQCFTLSENSEWHEAKQPRWSSVHFTVTKEPYFCSLGDFLLDMLWRVSSVSSTVNGVNHTDRSIFSSSLRPAFRRSYFLLPNSCSALYQPVTLRSLPAPIYCCWGARR